MNRLGQKKQGFSYIEVIIAVLFMSVVLVSGMEAIIGGIQTSELHQDYLVEQHHMKAKLEEILAQPFEALDAAKGLPTTASSYSEAPATPMRRLVYISAYDGDNLDTDDDGFTGTDSGLLWVRVEIENSSHGMATLVSE